MESLNNSSDDEIISPENNYKFDNYGIVMADSIEDLLYDKYNHKKSHTKHNNKKNNNINDDSSELIENENKLIFKHINDSSNKEMIYNLKQKDNKAKEKAKNKVSNNCKYIHNNLDNTQNYKDIDYLNKLRKINNKFFQISNNYNNKEKNKMIKIILNINNKEKREIKINPNDNKLIKTININIKNINKKEDIGNVSGKRNSIKDNFNENTCKIKNDTNELQTKMLLKKKEYEKNRQNEKKIRIIYSSEKNNKNSNEKEIKENIHKQFRKNNKIMLFPNLPKCYFIKENKIIIIRKHAPLQNVKNTNYFCTKEIINKIKKSPTKVYIRKIKNKKQKDKNKNKMSYNQSAEKKINIIRKNKGEYTLTELNLGKYRINPNILIKIVNPKPSNKCDKIDFNQNPSKKTKICQKAKYKSLDNNFNKNIKSYLINRTKKFKNKMQNNHNRYENKNESTDSHLLKNKEIISALNNSSNFKINCPYKSFNKNKTTSKTIFRNLRLKNKKNISQSQKNIQMNLIKPKFKIKKKLNNSQNEEEKSLKKYILYSAFPKRNKILYDNRNISLKKQNCNSCNIMNKYSNQTHFEFPIIDSYFY